LDLVMRATNPDCRKTRAFQHCVDFATLVRYTSGVEHRMERRLAAILAKLMGDGARRSGTMLLFSQGLSDCHGWEASMTSTFGWSRAFVIGLITLGTWLPTMGSLAADGAWSQVAVMSPSRLGLHANAIEGKIYIVGGGTALLRPITKVDVFDPTSGGWSQVANMPTGRGFLGTAVVHGRLYAIGGSPNITPNDPAIGTVESYDPATDSWRKEPDMRTPRADLTANVVDGRIYAIGGTRHVGVDALGTVEMYDPAGKSWTRKADMPTPRLHLTSAVVDGKIYVFGGSPEWPVPLATVEIYDPVSDSWSPGADMPTARTGIWCAALDGKIYVVGGLSWENEALATVEVYDPATDSWEAAPDMPTPRMLMAVVSLGGRIYVLGGGATNYASQSAVEVFTPR
jgi:N-acetylneuraminic acid mutarotase